MENQQTEKKTRFKVFISSSLFIFLVLLIWKESYSLSCFSIIFPIIIFIIIASSFIELEIKKRECFKNCYFKDNSFISKLLSSRIMIIIFYILSSIILSLYLSYSILEFSFIIWIYLIFHIFFVWLMYNFIRERLLYTIKDNHLMIFSRELTINISSIILFLAYAYFFITGPEPTYLQPTFDATLQEASKLYNSNCEMIAYFLKLKIEIDASFWWIINFATENINNKLISNTILILFIIINSLAIIGFNRFLIQVVYLVDKIQKVKVYDK